MRIIVIPNEPNPNMTGRHYFISKALAKRGHEVHEIMWDLPTIMSRKQLLKHLFTSLFTRDYEYEDLHIHKIARLPLFWPYVNGWLFKYQVKKLHRRIGADIIFAESYTNETTVPKGLPFIYDLADDYAAPGDIYGSPIYKLAFRILGVRKTMAKQCRRALAVTAVSDILCDYAKQHNSNVTKLPNGVDAEVIKAVAKSAPTHTNPHSIFYVTGFGPWSRPIETMRAVMALRKKFPQIDLTLAGDGPEAPKIKQFIEEHDVSDFIHYLGFVSDRKKVFSLIQQSAIGLNISEKNAWRDAAHPIKVLEYSSLGKKVVSTDLEGVKTLGYPNVFMFSDGDAKNSFQKVLEKALSANDETNYQDVSAAVLSEYEWKTIIARLEMIADKVRQPQIVHVIHSFPPSIGGMERAAQMLATEQAKLGMDVTVLTANTVREETTNQASFAVERMKSFTIANTVIIPGLLRRLLMLQSKDVVHMHVVQAYMPEVVWLASKIRGFRYVAQIHLDAPASGPAGFLLKIYKPIFLRRVLRDAHKVVVPTKDYETLVGHKYGISPDKLVVIPYGTEHVVSSKPRKHPQTILKLLFVGRLGYQKNIPFMVQALGLYAKKYDRNFTFTIVGSGPDEQIVRDEVRRQNLDDIVVFAGALSGKALEDAYAAADLLLLSSHSESFGIVLLEAMTKGLPIVSTDIMAVRNVVQHQRNALLTSVDIDSFIDAVHTLATNSEQYESISRNNLGDVTAYRWDTVNARFMESYT